jgi:hypothetical protein
MKAALLIMAITAIALAVAYFAIGPTSFIVYMSDLTEAQFIRSRFHLRLIQPEWVSTNGSVLMNWIVAETKARLGAIAFFWLCAVIFTIRYEMCGNESVDAK